MANQAVHDSTQGKPNDAKIERLKVEDAQFRAAWPLKEVVEAKRQPGKRIAQVVQAVMEGYSDRPALGQRARELVSDPASGRATLRLLPRFDTITYGELWARARAVAGEWHAHGDHPFRTGDFVCTLGFTSPEYGSLLLSIVHLGGVVVPLQTSAPTPQHGAIIAETEPRILASGIEYIEAAVNAVLAGYQPQRLVVFDYDSRDDDQRDALEAARERLAEAGSAIVVDTLDELVRRGEDLPEPPLYVAEAGEDPLTALFYTSGSTGTPKGAVFTESLSVGTWLGDTDVPAFTLSFMPMAHLVGHGYLIRALANGGTSFCSPRSDLSTLFEDFSLARPTAASIVPRVCELFYHHYLGELDRRVAQGGNAAAHDAEIKREMRDEMLGGRLLSVGCGSASLAPETYAFMEDMLGFHIPIGYSSTEIAGGTVTVDWKIQRPPVIDYKLRDVPELGYFNTDKPHPRGELLVKSDRFTGGYYKQPELTAEKWDSDGYYATGDIMAEMGPDHIVFLDRVNNVIKLSQGEFVAVSKLEADYAHAQDIRQIYIHGSSERAFLVAVVVPSEELAARIGTGDGAGAVKAKLRRALQQIAEEQQLNGFEVPRDFIVETVPFSLKNGLLSEVGKHQRPKLRARYMDELEQLYTQLAGDQLDELRALRLAGAEQPVLETVGRALQATLGISQDDVRPEVQFADLGGDSLSALSFSTLLEEIFGVEVPVGVIISPAGNVRQLAEYIEAGRGMASSRATFAKVHDVESDLVPASDLTLDKFIDAETLAAAPGLPQSAGETSCVLVTGATGFLGRFQMLAWLERMGKCGGKVICIARGSDAAGARKRIEDALDTDPALMAHFRALADKHLEVLPGDLGLPDLGLGEDEFARLASEVDLIVHPAAHVNHVLPYNQLFTANVAGTAELIRLALTSQLKQFHYVSTLGINSFAKTLVDEDSDIREAIPSCQLDESYANGYGISKWAGEVLLREAHDLCGLPIAVFRPGMILAHSRYVGQINVPDMFTRLLFSLVATGVAPATFYAQDLADGRPEGRYDGLSVDFLADAVTAIGAGRSEGFQSYNLSGGQRVGASLDSIVDWLVAAGCPIERIEPYDQWISHFETAMHALPEEQKQESMLAILGPYRRPQAAGMGMALPAETFQSGCADAGIAIPQLSEALIRQYVVGLQHHRLIAALEAA
ncbi:MAG: carboxylic acid reductase [Novosphingobium sp.]|nr:carboxylic acid reductase [Novosphingobium sp.]